MKKNKLPGDRSLLNYRGSIPDILRYQLLTQLVLAAITWMLRQLRGGILWTSGRSAFTSGDVTYMLQTVQGWLLLILGIAVMLCLSLLKKH